MMQLFTKLTKPMLGFALFALASLTANAQVATNYNFSQSNGTYAAVNGTTLGARIMDDEFIVDPAVPAGDFLTSGPGFPIGFSFTYNGFTFDRFGINANGWISLGTTADGVEMESNFANYTPLSATRSTTAPVALGNRIAALAQDMETDTLTTPSIVYRTIGAAPNRTLVIQWTGFKNYGNSTTGSSYNFQIRLSESGNVETKYGVCTGPSSARNPQVGLGGSTNTDFNSRTGTNWAASAPSVTNTGAMTLNATTTPASGLTYTWSPAACAGVSTTAATAVTATSGTANWNTSASAISYNLQYRVVGSPTWTAFAGNPIAVGTTSANLTGLTTLATYEYQVQINCSAVSASGFSASQTFICCAPVPGDDAATAIQVTALPFNSTGSLTTCNNNSAGTVRPGVDMYYRFTPSVCASAVSVSLCAATNFDSYLVIYNAATGAQIALNDDGCSPASTLSFTPVAGVTYYAVVEGYSATTYGNFSINITETLGGPASILTTTPISPSCVGLSDGSIMVAATGIITSYLWSDANATTTAMLSNVPAGTYTVTVTNSCNGTSVASVTLVSAFNTVMTAVSAVSCNAGTNGAANITVTGAGATPMYMWSNGTMTEDITGVVAGVYTVTITSAGGCTATLVATVTEPTAIDNLVLATSPLCPTSTNGMLDLSVSGGTPLVPVTGTLTTNFTSNNGSSGNMFDVDALQSTNITGFEVNIDELVGTSKVVDVYYKIGTWNGSETNAAAWTLLGNVTVSAAGIDVPTIVTLPTPLAVSAGTTYSFFIATDFSWRYINGTGVGNAWFSNPVLSIKQGIGRGGNTFASAVYPAPGTPSGTGWVTQSRAFSGSIIYNLPAPTPYLYTWSTAATTEDIMGLAAATYTVTVTDANACTATTSTLLNAQSMIEALPSTAAINCFGGVSPTVTISPAGGITPYTYNWSNGNMTDTQNALLPGLYTVTVTDMNMCTTTSTLTVTQPAAALTSMNTVTNVRCNGGTTGAIVPMTMGGTAPYIYSPTTLTGLSAGIYAVTVTDDNGCSVAMVETITEPAMLMTTATNIANNTTCIGTPTGEAMATVLGGTPTYTYIWSNGSMNAMNSGLAAGTYTVTISDINNCSMSASVAITSPFTFAATASSTNINCFGAMNGTASATTTGGTPTYTYTWSNGGNTATISNLMPGTYTAVVTDNGGCASTITAVVTEPSAIVNTLAATNVVCFGTNTGNVMAMTTGGTAPYNYSWSNSATLNTANNPNLFAGDYYVLVTDAVGCSLNSSITVTQASAGFTVVSTSTNQTAPNNGAISLSLQGGTAPYMVMWSNNATTQNLTGINAGTYTATVTDASGCSKTVSATVAFIIETQNLANFSTVNLYPNPTVGPFTLSVQLATAQTVTIDIFAVTGQAIATQTMQNVSNQKFDFDLSAMPSGMYFARIKAGDETKIVKISAITK